MADSFLNIKITAKGKLFKVSGQNISIGKDLEERLGDKKILKRDIKEVAQMVKDKITTNIYNAKSFTGGGLPKLKPSTIKKKKSTRILFETGKLAKGVIVKDEGDAVSVTMGGGSYKGGATVLQVAEYTQAGSSNRAPRRFFGITKKDVSKFVNIVLRDRLFKGSPRRAA